MSACVLALALLVFLLVDRVPKPAAAPTAGRVEVGGTLAACTDPSRCPVGFCYWRALRGPFWQRTDASIPPDSPSFRGSALRIYVADGRWKWSSVSDATGMAPRSAPGGTVECTLFQEVAAIANPAACFSIAGTVSDPTGARLSASTDVTGPGGGAHVLSGIAGNVAQSDAEPVDWLRLVERDGRVYLTTRHSDRPHPRAQLGPLRGESWTSVCGGWTPELVARDVLSTSDVRLVASPLSRDARCYLTGIRGAWSSTSDAAPFAEIYEGAEQDLRLRVFPSDGMPDRVGAYASCFRLR